ncbi:DUF7576 family protein [Halosimplex salinum]|uniref:DUF7576 family protein n=1 Tax=Halosimplex salinum TaxID=1710538 RepID=UPI0013DE51D9|nr:hypothetical protein [Halosimplex salinum]
MASSAGPDPLEVCARCGERLVGSEWYPARTRADGDGSLTILSFCDDRCLRAWRETD